MSRNGPSQRYNISKPRALDSPSQTSLIAGDLRTAGAGGSPYPAFVSSSSGQSQGRSPYSIPPVNPSHEAVNRADLGLGTSASARFNGDARDWDRDARSPIPPPSSSRLNVSGHASRSSISNDQSPLRPARSQRRSQAPEVPEPGARPNGSGQRRPSASGGVSGRASASGASLFGQRRPSASAGSAPLGIQTDHLEPSEMMPTHGARSPTSDPWAAEREQRSQARQQSKESEYAAAASQRGASASDKLRFAGSAFMSATKNREPESARRTPRRRAGTVTAGSKENWDDIGRGATGGKFAEIDTVMMRIKRDWPFVLEGDFSASSLALSLLSESQSDALPEHPDLQTFMDVHGALSNSLQKSVQEHFQTFAASLPMHATFMATLERAQAQVKASREELKNAREGISGQNKAELASVRNRERMVREMLQILDLIDELKQVPEQLEEHIAEKRFLQSALLLVKSIKSINREDIREIGAMSDLRQYLLSQEGSLTDLLIEELHTHIYLKTISSEARWRTYTPGQHTLPVIEAPSDSLKDQILGENDGSRFSQYLAHLAIKPNQEPILSELTRKSRSSLAGRNTMSITSINSLAYNDGPGDLDSFTYMESLLEALGALGRLGQALDTLVQRVPSEIHTLIETTMEEVNDRADQRAEEMSALAVVRPQQFLLAEKHDLESMPLFDNDTLRVVISLDGTGPPKNAIVLHDLFWTLFSKLAAVMEGHRAVYEVSRWIASRRDFKDVTRSNLNLNVPVLEVWRPVHQEVRTLLEGYLLDESKGSSLSSDSIPSINKVLQALQAGKYSRDKQRELFKFSDSDVRAVNSELKELDEGLKQALRTCVPGLINLQAGEANVISGSSAAEDSTSGYRTLIPPNSFNVTVLFQPTLAFIERAISIVPPGFEDHTTQFGTVLEEFVKNVFLPQLEDKVAASTQHAVSGSDAFQLDTRPIIADLAKPPLKSSVRVMALIQSLCIMLQETPFHREKYSNLVVGVVAQYYDQLYSRFRDLATMPGAMLGTGYLALPAVWAQSDDITPILIEMRAIAEDDHKNVARISMFETQLETTILQGTAPVESQLLRSNRRLESFGNLATSTRWFMNALLDLQILVDEDQLDNPLTRVFEPGEAPRLPLTPAMSQKFETIVRTYEQLIEITLNTLHLEVRCRVLCNLSAALHRPDQRLETEAFEPFPDIVDLNTSLMELEGISARTLSEADKNFMFRGLSTLIDYLFVHAARDIKVINTAGVNKIRRSILSLQQTLRDIITTDEESMLLRANEFWGLYELGPKKMLSNIDTNKPMFTFDDYNAMLALQCNKDTDAESADLNAHLIDLHAVAMNVEGWEVGL